MQSIKVLFDKKAAIISFVAWVILNISGISEIYLTAPNVLKVIPYKLLHLIFLYVVFYKILSLIKNAKSKKGKSELITLSVCFWLFLCALLLSWPGAWSWDDIDILARAQNYDPTAWQHFFSGTFYIIALQTFPFASGVLITQIICISLICGYVITNLSYAFGKTERQTIILGVILTLVMFLPPILLYSISGFRMGLYSFIELLLLAKLILVFKEHKKISLAELCGVSVLTVIVAAWRSEAIYYPIMFFVLLLALGKKIISAPKAIIASILVLCSVLSIGSYNSQLIGNSNYSITATLDPMVTIIRDADNIDDATIEKIDKVITVELIDTYPSHTGEELYWTDGFVKKYTEDEYSEYLKCYAKLALKNPGSVLSSCFGTFMDAVGGIGENGKQTTRNAVFTSPGGVYEVVANGEEQTYWSFINSLYKNPISSKVRVNFILFLGGVDSEQNINVIHNVFWSCWIPLALAVFSLIYYITKRKWFLAIVVTTVSLRCPMLILTSPAPYFMYYLSLYLCIYILGSMAVFDCINHIVKKRGMDKCQKLM